jgi:ATP-dependent protease Clp ATPase subunit
MSVAVYNHYKRLMQQQMDDEVEIEKKYYGGTNRNREDISS